MESHSARRKALFDKSAMQSWANAAEHVYAMPDAQWVRAVVKSGGTGDIGRVVFIVRSRVLTVP